jgi:SAM-dependent methyltransferase
MSTHPRARESTYRLSQAGFVRSDGFATRTIQVAGSASAGTEWHHRQSQALPGYLHEVEAVPVEMQHLYSLFSWYIAAALLEGHCQRILDIGCGIGVNLPPYVRPLQDSLVSRGIQYVGLDPIDQNLSGRDYPFICGRIEDLPPVLEGEFDLFLFATSLDHLEDTARAAEAVRKLSAPRALGIFWFGLHDPSVVAEELGRKWFGRLYSSLNPLVFLVRAALVVAVMARRYPDMVRRARQLRHGIPLDRFHFSYFTRSNMLPHLEHFGEVRDLTHITGTNSSFAAVEIRGDRSR